MRRPLVALVALVTGLIFASPAVAAPLTAAQLGGNSHLSGPGGSCTAGFAATQGAEWYLIAGPGCTGGTVSSGNGVLVGTVVAQTTSGASLVHVTNHTDWNLVPWVGGGIAFTGSTPAPVGATVCLLGDLTGWHCGQITARDVTVSFPNGTVTGLTRTTVCHEPGDPAVTFVSGSQAQGVLIGGSGSCTSGATTFFAPVNPILATYDIQLLTS